MYTIPSHIMSHSCIRKGLICEDPTKPPGAPNEGAVALIAALGNPDCPPIDRARAEMDYTARARSLKRPGLQTYKLQRLM